MVEPMKIDGPEQKKKPVKRKRSDPYLFTIKPDEKLDKIKKLQSEINSLVNFCKELVSGNGGALLENVGKNGNSSVSLSSLVACLMEGSGLPLSKLVDEIFEKVKGRIENLGDSVSKASVKSTVIMIGQRLCYGVVNVDADVLEDDAECALWCWETRDLKLIPKVARNSVKVHRTCWKKIQERINAVLAMVTALEKSDGNQNQQKELMKSSEKLAKVLNEADIRLLVQNTLQKNVAEMDEMESMKEEKLLIKQMEKSKREIEKERKKIDRELQMEKLRSKQLKKQQEETIKDQRRKEKEKAELKRRLAIQKQASIMERFLKQSKPTSSSKDYSYMKQTVTSESSFDISERMSESATLTMDSVLAQTFKADAKTILNLHLNSWRCAGSSTHSSRKKHWGLRQKPKTELVKELKLTTYKEPAYDEDSNIENILDDKKLPQTSSDEPVCSGQKRKQSIQLLQFDKSHRPAFYGVWRRNIQVVGARHPFAMDPDIDYEIDSDEEWEEEEPGENLSDCDKEDEDESVEHLNGDDEDESEDGFFVPDGYLSENEGVHGDELDSDELIEEVRDLPDSQKQEQSEEFRTLLRQQSYLNKLTDHALKKNKPLIILNLMHEKNMFLPAQQLTSKAKLEQMCLQTLCIRPFPGFPEMAIPNMNNLEDEEIESSPNKSITESFSLQDSDLPQIISIIQSCQQSIGKIVELLHNKFQAISKSELRNKVREISEFSNNRWQVKKEILRKLGLSVSPAKNSIAAFMKKSLPPGKTMNLSKTSTHQDC